jgi:hypothetical protein
VLDFRVGELWPRRRNGQHNRGRVDAVVVPAWPVINGVAPTSARAPLQARELRAELRIV